MHRCIPCTVHVLLWDNCTLFNWVPRKWLPQTVQRMRSLSVIIAMLVSSSVMGQAFNCGMFGLIADNHEQVYVGRFDLTLDSVQLESIHTCEVITAPINVWDIHNRKRWTVIWMDIDHPKFDGAGYKIKYPSGSWQIIREKNDVSTASPWWPVEPALLDD